MHFAPAAAALSPAGSAGALSAPTALLGYGVDLYGTIWTYANMAYMLEGARGVRWPDLFFPFGWDQGAAQGYAWLDAVLVWPVVRLVGVPGFYNLALLLLLATSQAACAALFRAVGAPWVAAAGLSAALALNPFVQQEVSAGRPTQVFLAFHALFLWAIWRLGCPDGRPLRHGLIAGVAIAAAGYVYWFGALAVGLVGAVVVALGLLGEGRRRVALGAAVGLAVAVALVAAPTWRVSSVALWGGADGAAAWLATEPRFEFQAGPLSFQVRRAVEVTVNGPSQLIATLRRLGLVPALFVLAGASALVPGALRRAGPWLLAGLLLATMPFGQLFRWGDTLLLTALGAVRLALPVVERLDSAGRTVVGPLLALFVSSAIGLGALSRRGPIGQRAALVLGALVLLGAFAGRPRAARASRFAPLSIYVDAAARWPGGIIDVPLEQSNYDYVQQLYHHQPLLGGPGISGPWTRPAGHARFCADNGLLVALEQLAAGKVPGDVTEQDRAALWDAGFRVVVVHAEASRTPLTGYAPLLGPIGLAEGDHGAFPLAAPSGD